MFRSWARRLWEFITMSKRPIIQTPKIGQIVRNTTTGLTLLVVGIAGQATHPILSIFLTGNALATIAKENPILAAMFGALAQRLHRIQYGAGTVILGDGTGLRPHPWPPEGWEVVTHLSGAKPNEWKPATPEALALAAQLDEQQKAEVEMKRAAITAQLEAQAEDEGANGGVKKPRHLAPVPEA